MYLNKEIDEFILNLEANSFFSDMKIIKAYPYAIKPTRLKKTVIAVSPSQISAKNISLGETHFFADYKIDVDIYVPQQFGADSIINIVREILGCAAGFYAVGVTASKINADDNLNCFTSKCTVEFNGEIDLGGNENEQ